MYAWLLWCGIAGSLLLLLYYLGHTLRWVRLMREGNVSRMLDDVRVVYSPAVSSPCSLFNCIFINRRDLGENEFRELMGARALATSGCATAGTGCWPSW